MRIVFQSIVEPFGSYSLHLFALVRGLVKMGFDPVIRPIKRSGDIPMDIQESLVAGVQPEPLEILLAPLSGYAPTPGKKTIRMFSWETTRIPAKEVALVNLCHCAVVPSNFVATVASASGVDIPIIVVPLGVSEEFAYRPMPPLPFTFACAGNLTNGIQRKGVHRIIDLFQEAFPEEQDARLNVKAFGQTFAPTDKRIKVDGRFVSEPEVAAWLASCHCFINFATGGWELWAHQALASGRAVIGCAFGGMADYFNDTVGFVVSHNLVPAGDSWRGMGVWAEPDRDSAIEAMHYAFKIQHMTNYLSQFCKRSSSSVLTLTWANSCKRLASVIEQCSVPVKNKSIGLSDGAFTVAITSFKRPKHLDRAIASAVAAGADYIVVSSMEPDEETSAVIQRYKEKLGPVLIVSVLPVDLGCNSLWLDAAYHSPTEHLIILHDDDFLDAKLGGVYQNVIRPALNSGAGFASWRGHVVWDSGEIRPIEWFHGETRLLPSSQMEAFVGKAGQLSLSPVVSMFKRSVLISALKEAEQCLNHDDCLLRPGMLLGTEVLAYLRHCSTFHEWLYVNQVLSYYGAHDGSGTVQAERGGDLKPLIVGYDRVRAHFKANRNRPPAPAASLIFIYSPYEGHEPQEVRRMENAYHTWRFHFEQGTMLEFPITVQRDSTKIGDDRRMPYVRDVMDYGLRFARPEDVIVYCNRDLCLTTKAPERILAGVARGGGIAVGVRRNWPYPPAKILRRTVLNCKTDGGFDLFAFTPAWWIANRSKMPDMIVGREAWDTVLRVIAEESGRGDEVYVDDVSWHENHMSYWIEHRKVNKGQIHNRKLGLEFFKQRKDERAGWIIKQLST